MDQWEKTRSNRSYSLSYVDSLAFYQQQLHQNNQKLRQQMQKPENEDQSQTVLGGYPSSDPRHQQHLKYLTQPHEHEYVHHQGKESVVAEQQQQQNGRLTIDELQAQFVSHSQQQQLPLDRTDQKNSSGKRKSVCWENSIVHPTNKEESQDAMARRASMPVVFPSSERRHSISLGHSYTPLTSLPTLGKALAEGSSNQRNSIHSFLHTLGQVSFEEYEKKRGSKKRSKKRQRKQKRTSFKRRMSVQLVDQESTSEKEEDTSTSQGLTTDTSTNQFKEFDYATSPIMSTISATQDAVVVAAAAAGGGTSGLVMSAVEAEAVSPGAVQTPSSEEHGASFSQDMDENVLRSPSPLDYCSNEELLKHEQYIQQEVQQRLLLQQQLHRGSATEQIETREGQQQKPYRLQQYQIQLQHYRNSNQQQQQFIQPLHPCNLSDMPLLESSSPVGLDGREDQRNYPAPLIFSHLSGALPQAQQKQSVPQDALEYNTRFEAFSSPPDLLFRTDPDFDFGLFDPTTPPCDGGGGGGGFGNQPTPSSKTQVLTDSSVLCSWEPSLASSTSNDDHNAFLQTMMMCDDHQDGDSNSATTTTIHVPHNVGVATPENDEVGWPLEELLHWDEESFA